jgi:hypothetical protein
VEQILITFTYAQPAAPPRYLYPFNADLLLHIPMKPLPVFVVLLAALFPFPCASQELKRQKCRNIPGSVGYPNVAAWSRLNMTIAGRLVVAVPSAKHCASLPGGTCTDAQWTSALFRNTIPGAMNQVVALLNLNLPIRLLIEMLIGQLGTGRHRGPCLAANTNHPFTFSLVRVTI